MFEELNQVCANIVAMINDMDDLNSFGKIWMDMEMCVVMAKRRSGSHEG